MKKLKVLLVDDEIIIRQGFRQLFDWEAHNCEVVGEAADGMEALSQIDALNPDIVTMDINIPIMNGLKVIQLSRIKHPDTAFIIVSGYDDFSYCREALRLQITDYILKPVNYEEFGSCIDNLKIALFQRQTSKSEEQAEERTINNILRFMQEHLTEEEHAIYKRGRNAKSVSPAKNQSVTDYRRATGFEALMGYLYLKKEWKRMLELVKMGLESISE